ncbi:MAG: 2-amino-4-hydroxy-6-hydroxymethyldihydropteridine diphosphokinase [Crocinitomicaceae bacterium]
MQQKKAIAILGLGTNMGDKIQNIKEAIAFLKEAKINILKISKVYQTPPWGFKAKDDFFNLAVKIETKLSPILLLVEIKAIELKMGRPIKLEAGYSSRLIDIDIIDFNNETYNYHDLIIPHPYMQSRNFVLYPLRDLEPSYKHPILNKTISQIIAELNDETIALVNIPAL